MKKAAVCIVVIAVLSVWCSGISFAKDLSWEGNSRAMYDKTVEIAPGFMKPIVEKQLMDAIVARAGESGKVSEDMVVECVKKTTPAQFVDQTLKEIEPLKTKK